MNEAELGFSASMAKAPNAFGKVFGQETRL